MADTNDSMVEDAFDDAELKSSKPWLRMLAEADKAGQDDYDDKCDAIDKRFADMERLASTTRDREFQIFWANVQVLAPSVYARPPVPVVSPRPWVKGELERTTSELLERCAIVSFEREDIDGVMKMIRDDVVLNARGVGWVRYEAKNENGNLTEKACIEHLNRRDFRHDPARNWKEVDWVGRRAWMTRKEMKKRFAGDLYKEATFAKRKDEPDSDDGELKAAVWEMWCRSLNRVVWVTEGVEQVLEQDSPHLTLEGFFPCPKPAYATVQRHSLVPVPDYVFYKDQIEEINELTARISALSDSVKLRGFYPAGAGEIGDAIEAAIKSNDDRQVLIGVADWAMLGNGNAKDAIVWLPLDMVTATIQQLVELRRQLIEDVYQITGLSDIMRGDTQASETLGAQQLKSQYGSVRIRDKQDEIVRMARDLTRLSAEIMAENFQGQTLLDMSQMRLPTDADIKSQANDINAQLQQIMADVQQSAQDPEVQQMAQQDPEQAQQIVEQAQQQGEELQGQLEALADVVTIDKVMQFLRDQRLRPFILDIETDSTIAPDEQAQKQQAAEFLEAVGGFMERAIPMAQQVPEVQPLTAEMLKFVAGQFRAGREMYGIIEEFADRMKEQASQPQEEQPDPDAIKAQAEAEKMQADAQAQQAELALKQQESERQTLEAQSKAQHDQLEQQIKQQEAIDASAARQQEIKDKSALAAVQRDKLQAEAANSAQRHAQDMELGELQVQLAQANLGRAGKGEAA